MTDRSANLVVALEASTRTASVAIESGTGESVLERSLDPERAHASDLLPALHGLLAENGARPSDIGTVAVGLGPGSYTGLRVAVALAQGIALGGGVATVGVPSIEAELYSQLNEGERGSALRDARGGRFTLGTYRRLSAGIELVRAPRAIGPEAADAWIREESAEPDAVLVAEPGLVERLAPAAEVAFRTLAPATAGAVLRLGRDRLAAQGPTPPGELAPLYLAEFEARPRAR